MGPIAYYFFIKPLSLLPLRVLHGISTFLYFFIYHVFGIRKKVVYRNLNNSFPDKPPEEIEEIAKKFYRHFCDIIVESLKLFHISKEELVDRSKFVNPEVLNYYYDKGNDNGTYQRNNCFDVKWPLTHFIQMLLNFHQLP